VAVEFHPIQDDWGGGPGVIDLYKAADMRKWPEPYDAGFKGYNIYVSTFPEGPFVLAVNYPLYGLGKDLVLVGFQPGKPYYFTFTNVFRDESESARSKVLKVIGQEPPPRPTPTPRG
jgi:hypothetical protein